MKKYILLLIIALLAGSGYSFPAHLQSWKLDEDIKALNALNISIDNVCRETGGITIYLRDDREFDLLRSHGFQAERLPDIARENALAMQQPRDPNDPQPAYYTLDQYHSFMQQTAAQYPNLCELVQIGSSGQERPIYFIRITNTALSSPKPQFKYISSIHGDEVVGYDMMIRLIQLLTSEYGTDPRITNLVDNIEIWINPMMNPDGYALGQRYNAAGIDLNRNFPMPTGVQHPDGNPWGVENVAMMAFDQSKYFTLSANLHGGALVMNYPWDYNYALTPDDALVQDLALSYAIHNSQMYNSSSFTNGITNGAAWYVITGSMQDWNYYFTNNIDLTAEIGTNKWPPASQLDSYWQLNQESILSYMENVLRGVKGVVQSSSGNPLSAEIRIGENSKIVSTNPANGAYHRMLLPGTYSVTASASGYISQTHEVTVLDPLASVQNFSLDEAQVISFQGSIRDAEGYPISGASVIIEADPEISLLADVNGIFTIPALYEGDYQVRIASAGLGIFNKLVSFRNGDSYKTFVLLPPLFEDEFENGLEAWTIQSPWAIINQEGNNLLTDSPSGNYSNNANRSARITTPINLSGISSPTLCFKTRYDLESGYDFVHVEASLNGTTWTNLTSFTGEQDSWAQQSLSLANYSGQNVYIRFRLRSDSNISDDGIYLDDVLISGTSGNITIFGDVSRDQILAEDDAQAILDYSIGLDPIPQVDALPWEPGTIQAAEVSGDENVNSLDAWLVHRFLLDTGFRFPVQSGEAIELQIPELESSVEDNRLRLFFSPQVELKAFNLSFANDPGFQIGEIVWGPNSLNGMRAQNLSGENRTLAYLSRGEQFDYVDIFYTASSSALSAEIIINGELRIYELSLKTSAQDSIGPAFAFSLLQNYPNPFNPSTLIKYSVPESRGATRLQIFNHKGQLVRTLIDETQAAGTYTATFDGLDDRGSKLGSGIYFYRLSLGTQSTTRKMILLK